MIRKLFSTLLCAFALLLLMGAGTVSEQDTVIVTQEDGRAAFGVATLETDSQATDLADSSHVAAIASNSPFGFDAAQEDSAPEASKSEADTVLYAKDEQSYVPLADAAKMIDAGVQIAWNEQTKTASITGGGVELSATVGQNYLLANGRYLFLPNAVQQAQGKIRVPLWTLTKIYGAQVTRSDGSDAVTLVKSGEVLAQGADYYNQTDLFWLSRVIFAESGNQPLSGKIAVGNVVMNRVASPIYPNSVEAVLAQKNQFTTYQSGALAKRTPNESSVIAAKLVLDGGVVAQTQGALYFDSAKNSWASRNKSYIATIGGHKFYR